MSKTSDKKTFDPTKLKPVTYAIFDSSSTAYDVVVLHGGPGCLKGKTAVVTGGAHGIGLETCKALAYGGCRVIMGTKAVEMGERVIIQEIKKPGRGNYCVKDTSNIFVKEVDMGDLLSIKVFANEILETEARVDFLILNESVTASRSLKYTSSGFEKQIGVNHFGHAYLTSLLRPKMERQPFRSRIIVLTSSAHSSGVIKLNDLHYLKDRRYTPWSAYANSKLANILYTKKLAEELKDTNVTAVCIHPGLVGFNISKEIFVAGFFLSFLFGFRKTIPQGAATTVWACLDYGIDSFESRGSYFADCALATPSSVCFKKSLIDKFWDETNSQLNEAVQSLDIDFRIERSMSLSNHVVDPRWDHNTHFSEAYEKHHYKSTLDPIIDMEENDTTPSMSDPDADYKLCLGLEDCHTNTGTDIDDRQDGQIDGTESTFSVFENESDNMSYHQYQVAQEDTDKKTVDGILEKYDKDEILEMIDRGLDIENLVNEDMKEETIEEIENATFEDSSIIGLIEENELNFNSREASLKVASTEETDTNLEDQPEKVEFEEGMFNGGVAVEEVNDQNWKNDVPPTEEYDGVGVSNVAAPKSSGRTLKMHKLKTCTVWVLE